MRLMGTEMRDAEGIMISFNNLSLQLQKMELELKCLKCMKLLNSPTLLPCGDMFCCDCIATKTEPLKCPVCMQTCSRKDVRPASHVEKMINIHKSMSIILDANHMQPGPSFQTFATNIHSSKDPISGSNNAMVMFQDDTTGGKSRDLDPYVPMSSNTKSSQNEAMIPEHVSHTEDVDPYVPMSSNTKSFQNEAMIPEHVSHIGVDLLESSCPASCGTPKVSDDINVQGSDPTIKGYQWSLRKRGSKDLKDDGSTQSKKQKPDDAPTSGINSKNILKSNSNSGTNQKKNFKPNPTSGTNQKNALKSCRTSGSNRKNQSSMCEVGSAERPASSTYWNCVFCHSVEINEVTGKMVHILNQKPVEVDQASQTGVLHVHQNCLEWAPQTYFEGETVYGLTTEMLRASKLKCSHCGKMGAALGCYLKSCPKTYHVPCAYQILKCRWDYENYHVLCPAHSGDKLPCDSLKENNKANDSPVSPDKPGTPISPTSQQSDVEWKPSPWAGRQWLIVGSGLSRKEKGLLVDFGRWNDVEVTNSWTENVTHIVAAKDTNGGYGRSMKYLKGILSGKWIVTLDWIKACIEAGHPVEEETYEVSRDSYGTTDGPKTGRIRVMQKSPKLFAGLSFYFHGHFARDYKSYLEDLVNYAGGELKSQISNNSENSATMLIVYNVRNVEEEEEPDEMNKVLLQWRIDAEAVAAQTGCHAIPNSWIVDSVAACTLQQFPK